MQKNPKTCIVVNVSLKVLFLIFPHLAVSLEMAT